MARELDAVTVSVQFERVLDTIMAKFPGAAEHLGGARGDRLVFTGFPRELCATSMRRGEAGAGHVDGSRRSWRISRVRLWSRVAAS
jgi:hypothetical protein